MAAARPAPSASGARLTREHGRPGPGLHRLAIMPGSPAGQLVDAVTLRANELDELTRMLDDSAALGVPEHAARSFAGITAEAERELERAERPWQATSEPGSAEHAAALID
jgi:hypothetical protein